MKEKPGTEIGGETAEAAALLTKYFKLVEKQEKEQGAVTVLYECDVVDLLTLHGVVCLGADHPAFQDLSHQSREAVKRFRGFCKRVWMRQGLSPEEAEQLDRLREEVSEGGEC